MESSHQVIARLQAEIEKTLAPYLPNVPFALVDFPNHANVGDSAIWVGERVLFHKAGLRPAYVCSWTDVNWPKLEKAIGPEGVIFIHGGGNFTDIYPHHQSFCSEILSRFKGHKVVQLPQTIFYTSPRGADKIARQIDAHGQFTLLARDAASFDLARQSFQCNVVLCPDTAFMLGALHRTHEKRDETLLLLRTDHERQAEINSTMQKKHFPGTVSLDWLKEPIFTRPGAILGAVSQMLGSPAGAHGLCEGYYDRLSRWRLERGLEMLSSFDRIVCDRLHAHILSTLLGIPHVLLDNQYGKIARYAETWSTLWSGVGRAKTVEEAIQLAGRLPDAR